MAASQAALVGQPPILLHCPIIPMNSTAQGLFIMSFIISGEGGPARAAVLGRQRPTNLDNRMTYSPSMFSRFSRVPFPHLVVSPHDRTVGSPRTHPVRITTVRTYN